MTLSLEEGRYDRQELISWWDQGRIRGSHILVVGAGALGNEVVKNLVLLGVGSIEVVDLDIVERSNLARCIFFREEDNGRWKAEVVAERASSVNPEVRITGRQLDVTKCGVGWVAGFDLVIGALDNREARLWINQACRKMGVTWIDGAIEGIRGVVKVFPPDGACYECTLGERDREILSRRRSCALLSTEEMLLGKVPTTATSASMIAALETQEAIRVLHGQESPIANSGWIFTGEVFDSYIVNFTEDEWCLAHDRYTSLEPAAFTAELTLSDLLEGASRHLGSPPDSIDLETELIRSASCPSCMWASPINKLLNATDPAEATCPTCHELGVLDVTMSIAPDDAVTLLSLRAMGVPDSDVVTIRAGEGRAHYLLKNDQRGG